MKIILSKNIKWLFHLFFWLVFFAVLNSETVNLEWGPMSKELGTLFIPLLFGMTVNAILFYTNAYWGIPKYLHKKNYRGFFMQSLFLVIGFTLLEFAFDLWYFLNWDAEKQPKGELPDFSNYSDIVDIGVFLMFTFVFNLFFWMMAFLYRWPKDWMKSERQKQQLIHDKLLAELDFLKSQINPHFLFNGINSIYHLIGVDNESARHILLKLSDLLRYQLYECNEPFISLKKELNYLHNFLAIQEIRKGEDITLSVNLPEKEQLHDIENLKIAPLLLGPFLENTFKHLSLHTEREKNVVAVKLEVERNELFFYIKNTFDPNRDRTEKKNASGIGLENVKRRLTLIYPGLHDLSIKEADETFEVELKITLR
ncbi:MAG: histidine kinase [Bacteroidota bacterium]